MKTNRKASASDPSWQTIHNQLAIFFAGTMSLIAAALFYNLLINNSFFNFVPQLLLLFAFTCYFQNGFHFFIFYTTQVSRSVRESYSNHPHYYWLVTVIFFVAIIASGAYFFLSWEKFVETSYSAVLVAAFGLIWWIIKEKFYKPKFEKPDNEAGDNK